MPNDPQNLSGDAADSNSTSSTERTGEAVTGQMVGTEVPVGGVGELVGDGTGGLLPTITAGAAEATDGETAERKQAPPQRLAPNAALGIVEDEDDGETD